LEKRADGRSYSVARMIKQITHSQIYVLDQDEALEFYVGKLGLEVNTDADLGFMRWLTVNVPGDPDHEILLEKPDHRPTTRRRPDRSASW
jgi:catechol 2,3-dioxygenase-like lactoylglutathione lyase family enzyme